MSYEDTVRSHIGLPKKTRKDSKAETYATDVCRPLFAAHRELTMDQKYAIYSLVQKAFDAGRLDWAKNPGTF